MNQHIKVSVLLERKIKFERTRFNTIKILISLLYIYFRTAHRIQDLAQSFHMEE